jgi:hypothetical protein
LKSSEVTTCANAPCRTFLDEVRNAVPDIETGDPQDQNSHEKAIQKCLDELTASLFPHPRTTQPGIRCDTPWVGVFETFDTSWIGSNISCTMNFFTDVLEQWGIVPETPDAVELCLREALGHIEGHVGRIHTSQDRFRSAEGHAVDWVVSLLPFSMPQDEVGLFLAFAASRHLDETQETDSRAHPA